MNRATIKKLLREATLLERQCGRAITRREIAEMPWEEFCDLFEAAILPESYDVMDEIDRQVAEYHARPPRNIGNGETVQDVHGFVDWLDGIRAGWASLPETIPHVVLLAWKNGHTVRNGCGTPVPISRCGDCHFVVPNNDVNGSGAGRLHPCPACGSGRKLEQMNLSTCDSFFTPKF
jgi:hypothetical protein